MTEKENLEDVVTDLVVSSPSPAKTKAVAKRGRPRKADIEAKKKPGKVGRPAGDAARIQELKARLLATTGDKVINKIVQIAMDDKHPGQLAALKMCFDRQLPLSLFEKDAKRGSGAITINIVGVDNASVVAEDVIDMEED